MSDSPFKGMVIELPPEQYDRAMAAISRARAAVSVLRNQLVGEGESDEPRIKESKRVVLHGNAIPNRLHRRLPRGKGTPADNYVATGSRQDFAGNEELRSKDMKTANQILAHVKGLIDMNTAELEGFKGMAYGSKLHLLQDNELLKSLVLWIEKPMPHDNDAFGSSAMR